MSRLESDPNYCLGQLKVVIGNNFVKRRPVQIVEECRKILREYERAKMLEKAGAQAYPGGFPEG